MSAITLAIPAAPILAGELEAYGGFTVELTSGRILRAGDVRGWAIGLPGTERIIGPILDTDAIAANVAELLDGPAGTFDHPYLGGWHDPERGHLVELSTIERVSSLRAVAIGRVRRQRAVRNMRTGREVTVPPRRTVRAA